MQRKEIARVMGITEKTVFNLERSALKKLRRAFRDRGIVAADLLEG